MHAQADDGWRLWKDRDGVEIYSRKTDSGYVEIRANTTVSTTLSAFIALLNDTAHIPQWMDSVSQVSVIEKPGIRSDLVHTRFRAPWPVADRDMVTLSEYHQPDPCSLVLEISDRHDALPALEGYVRMLDVQTRWTLEAQADGRVTVDYLSYANPSGNLPRWMANQASLQATYRTLQALRRELSNERYTRRAVEGVFNCT